jgi:DNA-binding CsgD family transcriptional regulator
MASLEQVFSAFLSPFQGTHDEWSDRSSSALKELLRADYSMYSENTIGQYSFRVADPPPAGLDSMNAIAQDMASPEPEDPLVHRMMMLERSGQLPIFTTPLLDSVLEGRFHETPFFRQVMQPAGMRHIAGLISVGATATRRLAVGWSVTRRFNPGNRTLGTLRLLHPAFHAACLLIDQAELTRRALLTTIDECSDGMALVTPMGTPLHWNPALRRMLGKEGESGALREALDVIPQRLRQSTCRSESSVTGMAEILVRSPGARYSVRGCMLSTTFGIPPKTMLITVTDVTDDLPLAGEIQRRFRLTRRQAEVARLLAGRLSDAEIASRLGVSWHTVRSHVDHVFSAMGVQSRQQIVERMRTDA